MRKNLFIWLAVLLSLFSLSAMAEENLLSNGDFSRSSGNFPDGWTTEVWYTDAGVSALTVESDGYEGDCIRVSNRSENDARYAQTVSVQPDTLYHISCLCRAEAIPEGSIGATISIKNTFSYSASLTDTDGEWVLLELYGRTGSDQTELTVYARVGGYGYLNSGTAWFDNFSMEVVEDVPDGAAVENFAPTSGDNSADEAEFGADEAVEPARNTEAFVLLTALYLLLVLAVVRKYSRTPERSARFYAKLMAGVLGAAFVLRAILAVCVRGYHTDVNCFTAWSEHMFAVGPANFYSGGIWCDYPPGYMLMLWPVAALRRLLNLSTASNAYRLLLKLWPIVFDLAGGWLIWKRGKETLGARAAMLLAAFYALNPASFTDSAAWGQIDSVFTLLIALCALEAAEGRYVPSLTCFALAVLIKPQTLLFAPLGLFALVVFCLREKDRTAALKRLAAGVGAALALLYVVALVCTLDFSEGLLSGLVRPVGWLIELYGSTMTSYAYVSVNALNLFYLFGLNWASADAYSGVMTVAWILFAVAYLYCFALCALSKNRRHLPLIGGLLILLIFTFGPMIHERYLYPALLLLPLGYLFARDRRVLISMVVLSATLFLNEFLVLQGGMTEANYGHLQSSELWINVIVSALNVLNCVYLGWTALDVCVFGHTKTLTFCEIECETPAQRSLRAPKDHRLHLGRKDALLMAAVTLVYSIAAFTNLGTTSAPQTMWVSDSAGDSVVFDLGDVTRFRMTYYGGVCNSNFTVELSNDATTWTEPYYAKYDQGEIFRWLWYTPLDAEGNTVRAETVPTSDGSAYVAFSGYESESEPFQTARYVRLTSVAAGLTLGEVGFLDEDGEAQPIASVDALHDGERLCDEQQTVAAYPSYYNGTYFDEIYHARTAYEHLHGLSTYEWTHPPLGKVLMMIGIQLFGMTPFGWRFMGALMGVLMVPLMYLLTKQVTHSTRLSFIAMFLLSVDSMHFTQTRIATIDSYAVFWIMLMYFFMIRYCQISWTEKGNFRRSLITLGLCGITMGVAWATKWICLYASVGLAVLFFWRLWRHFREYSASNQTSGVRFPAGAAITVSFCLIFFVCIPVLIYYFSYYWHLQSYGVQNFADMFSMRHVRTVANLQKSMLNYHAGLGGDTHYFRSEWYEWPIIWWPMWYFSGTAYMPSGVISSISCMGNPAVWWFGLIALIFVLVRAAFVRRASKRDVIVLIGFASQFLPWVLVPRSTFIYHYFASVPFIILASVLMLDKLRTHRSERVFRTTTLALTISALVLFIAFYPLESGTPVARWYANLLRWFKWYNF